MFCDNLTTTQKAGKCHGNYQFNKYNSEKDKVSKHKISIDVNDDAVTLILYLTSYFVRQSKVLV